MKKTIIFTLLIAMICALFSSCAQSGVNNESLPDITSLKLGEDYKDIEAQLSFLTFRTEIMDKLNEYAVEFNRLYPGIHITYKGVNDYEASAITYLNSGINWGDIMMIPLGIEKDVISSYFISLGSFDNLSKLYNFTSAWNYDGNVYGLASTGNANGILYNKRVFLNAGINDIPKTPDSFITALKAIKERTNAIPLYTNYADVWPMSGWDAYIGINATGKETYINQILVHAKEPFSESNGTGPYAVYKILYDAVSLGLTENDYSTTSEPLSYSMLNNGEIGCLVFSSWAVLQAQMAGEHPDDVGFMPFPISIEGKQYVSINGDYSYGIANNISHENQIASMLYVKWLVEESGFSYSEGGLSVKKDGEFPEFYDCLDSCLLMENAPAIVGEELLFNQLNFESGLLFNANGNAKVQSIVEHAFRDDKSFNDIMNEWNEKWAAAQKSINVKVN